ncbi:cyclic nucleotide-binding domain-containing protein [Pedobacter sp. LMG 31464]|uniref:Cyclic nucleotide-binding domain-containing protein n=1 Tax=Pedobacter planticolens TaxID=2679964 RepID=A0A923ITR5_9SPHI|nr:Crp/Fnr family transcriptional regulator [Pedobacter planticolens]MBB2143953.1 cyclic nucleotide-binding domain-containing protein [Pedobacter planticolens]
METSYQSQDFLQVLSRISPLPANFQERIMAQLLTEHHPAKDLLQQPGDISRQIYFIKSGFLRAYHLDHHGKQHTIWFAGSGELMISARSFFTQRPSEEYIETLQQSILQSLTWNQLQSYYADFPQANLISRIFTERYYIQAEERALFLRTQSPLQRYQLLLSRYPCIEQMTTTVNIASYLGMERETFSRMRSQLLRYKSSIGLPNLNKKK